MKEERRYITNADIPNVVEPCYITSGGELWQWSIRQKKMKQKAIFYDRIHDKAKVNIMLYDIDSKARYTKAKAVSVASLVYRYFSGAEIGSQLYLGYRDGDVMNCNISNLFQREERYNNRPSIRRTPTGRKVVVEYEGEEKQDITNTYGLQYYPKSLLLSDYDSVMVFFEMKKYHPTAVATKLTIDTTDWTAEQLRKLLSMRARLGDTIIK